MKIIKRSVCAHTPKKIKHLVNLPFAWLGTLYTASFSEDELQQMMLANPVLVYHGI